MANSKLQAFLNHPAGPKTKSPKKVNIVNKLEGRTSAKSPMLWGLGKQRLNMDLICLSVEVNPIRNGSTSFQWKISKYYVHFWAPAFKWGLAMANAADFSKPPEKLSYPQQTAVAITGLIWARYSTQIIPKNWNLVGVNLTMAGTGIYQLSRKIRQDYFSEPEAAVAQE